MRETGRVGADSISRRRLGVGLALAALAGGGAGPLLRTDSDPERAVAPAPTVAPRRDVGRIAPPIVYDVDFVDDRHGFALWGRCTDGADYRCERRLLVTDD